MVDEWAASVKPKADPAIITKHIEKMVEVWKFSIIKKKKKKVLYKRSYLLHFNTLLLYTSKQFAVYMMALKMAYELFISKLIKMAESVDK